MTPNPPDTTLSIDRRLELDSPPERVWRAITDPAELASWFGDSAELDLQPGGSGWFGWESHGRFAVRVERVEPPRELAWRWSKVPDQPLDQGPSTLVEWRLSPRPGGGTVLELRESGFETRQHREENTRGWKAELGELVKHLEAQAS